MKYQIDKQERYSVFTLEEPQLNSMIAPLLKSEFVFLRNEGVRNLIFDLQQVDYIDSSGLSSILTANRLWKDYGSFVLTNMNSEGVRKLIEISKLDGILTIIPTIDESVDYIFMEDIERDLNDEEE
ncbi:MAG: STAS domain-containing protein [Saprospiraceae bacterium]|nr:STAS domain-containing protein [Candidatus Vicinibacter affinis]MBP6174138.1 STAS domain-containing protein [Saprospiraceae bacterium]MBK6572304.1 STAS domain-containing protein [Candidatus Vicinibacter affinis]MBK6824281.1 STAS domain-containing protein [Candidatus Vicinibacter affinis]MBK7303892.1 STAS domain-containing protein [Candidatus Vicinibacter affinis]